MRALTCWTVSQSICLMGGAIGEGNWSASAEFNIYADPEAAAMVFQCGRRSPCSAWTSPTRRA